MSACVHSGHYSIKLNLDIHSPSKSPSPEKEEGAEGESEEGEEGDGELPCHTIVIDCAPIGFADSMRITVLEQVNEDHVAQMKV